MIKQFCRPKFGEINYEENVWTGKKKVTINGVQLTSVNKTTFNYDYNGTLVEVKITGNIYTGCNLTIYDEAYEIYTKTAWYEYILAILPFILVIVWGNSVALCKIVPVIGGAIGGAISGVFSFVSLSVMKSIKSPLFKVLIGVICLIATFVVCAIAGYICVAALS